MFFFLFEFLFILIDKAQSRILVCTTNPNHVHNHIPRSLPRYECFCFLKYSASALWSLGFPMDLVQRRLQISVDYTYQCNNDHMEDLEGNESVNYHIPDRPYSRQIRTLFINSVDWENHNFSGINPWSPHIRHVEVLKIIEASILTRNKEDRATGVPVDFTFHILVERSAILFEVVCMHFLVPPSICT